MARSPWRRIRLATIAGEWMVLAPGWAAVNLRRLDTSNGCQDHTLLPSAAAPFVLARSDSSRGSLALPSLARATLPRPPHPIPTSVTIREAPLLRDGMARLVAVIRISENQNIFSYGARQPKSHQI